VLEGDAGACGSGEAAASPALSANGALKTAVPAPRGGYRGAATQPRDGAGLLARLSARAVKAGESVVLPGAVRLVPARLSGPWRLLSWILFVARK
jgi:hypothetical protein